MIKKEVNQFLLNEVTLMMNKELDEEELDDNINSDITGTRNT